MSNDEIDPSKTRDMQVFFKVQDDKRSFRFAVENPIPLSTKYWMKMMVGLAIGIAEKNGLSRLEIQSVFDSVNRERIILSSSG